MQCFFHVFLSFNAYMVRPFTVFICSRCKFYNSPNTFSWLCPLRKTFPRNNPARKPPRNQDISLRLNSFSPARQNACCIWDICIAKKAYCLLRNLISLLLYYPRQLFASNLLIKLLFLVKNSQKNRPRPNPRFQKPRQNLPHSLSCTSFAYNKFSIRRRMPRRPPLCATYLT